jgi:hypothetical protein
MSLGSTQREFSLQVAELIEFIYKSGYECTLGDAYRDPRVFGEMGDKNSIIGKENSYPAYGRAESAHKQRLAIDLNLFKDNIYLRHTEAHRPFGEFWKSLHPDNRWGGDFTPKDGNHYSRKYYGIA